MKGGLVTLVTAAFLILGREVPALESSVGVGVGYVKANGVDATLVFNGVFRFHLSKIFALEPEVSYWSKSQSVLGVTASIEDLQFGVNALAVFGAGRSVEVFGGGGGGLHQITDRLRGDRRDEHVRLDHQGWARPPCGC